MKEFYERYYAAMARSQAHAEFCTRVFGRNLCQHGFADMAQLDALIEMAQLGAGQCALDVGCGNGYIAEYLSDCTGAQFTGLDYIPEAIQQAQARTGEKADRLTFQVGDINAPDLPAGAYDVIISIDSLYFSDDYTRTIRQWAQALKPGGCIVILYSYGREPWVPVEKFPADKLAADRTPLADALMANGLRFETRDFSEDDYRLAVLRRDVLADLRPRFEAEDTLFLYENRSGDADGIRQAYEEGLHKRYLYHAQRL